MADSETGSVSFDNLVLSDATALTDLRTLESGENVVRGQLLKLGTGTKLVAMDEYDADTDAYTIAATDADATLDDASIHVFTFGQFSIAAIEAVSTGVTINEAMRNQLWTRGLHVRDTLALS